MWSQHHQGTEFLLIVAKDVIILVRHGWWSRELLYNHQTNIIRPHNNLMMRVLINTQLFVMPIPGSQICSPSIKIVIIKAVKSQLNKAY